MSRPFRIPTALSLSGHWIPIWDETAYQSQEKADVTVPPIFALNSRPVFCPLLETLSRVAESAVTRAWPIGLMCPQAFVGITLTWQDPVNDICRPLQPGIECWLEDTDLWYLTLWTNTSTYDDFQEVDRLLGNLHDVLRRVPFFRSFCTSALKTMSLPECVPSPPPRARHQPSPSEDSSIDEDSFELVTMTRAEEQQYPISITLSLLERLESQHPIA